MIQKITIEEDKNTLLNKYPYFGIYGDATEEFIVFFSKEQIGVVIAVFKGDYKPGYYSCIWLEKKFHPFYGSIKIEKGE